MNARILSSALALGCVVAATSCTPKLSDPDRFNAEQLCDIDVREEMLIRRCGTQGCHSAYEPRAGLDFVTGGLAERLVGAPAVTCGSAHLIDVDHPEESFLLELVGADPECDGEPTERMPLIGTPMSDHEVDCLRAWIVEQVALLGGDAGRPRSDAGEMRLDGAVDAGIGLDAGTVPPVLDDAGAVGDAGGLPEVVIEAEDMSLDGYVVDSLDAGIVRVEAGRTMGAVSAAFPGAAGRYQLRLHVIAEPDAIPTYELIVDGASVTIERPPLTDEMNEPRVLGPYTLDLETGASIEIRGTANLESTSAWARIDRLVFRP